MKLRTRRLIGLLITVLFLFFYSALIAGIGNAFINRSMAIKIIFFAIAGIVWIFPLKPLYDWMRAKPGEMPPAEETPRFLKK